MSATTPEVYNHEYKFPCEVVSELNGRIEQSTISPFDRFRSQRGTLSVSPICPCSNLRSLILSVWIGVRESSIMHSKEEQGEKLMVSKSSSISNF